MNLVVIITRRAGEGLSINRSHIALSAPLRVDEAGRTMPRHLFGTYGSIAGCLATLPKPNVFLR